MTELMMPPAPAGSVAEQVAAQYTYLFQMAQQLNLALEQLDDADSARRSAAAARSGAGDAEAAAAGYERLRSLIVKTADTVEQKMERLRSELAGQYMALSDFGSYVERLNAVIEADPSALTQYYRSFSELRAAIDAVDADYTAYRTATEGYIKTGIVDRDGAVPIYGVAVGQDLETSVDAATGDTVIEKSHFRAVFTARRLAFWEDGTEVARVSDRKLYINDVTALSSLAVGEWNVRGGADTGLIVRWIGG